MRCKQKMPRGAFGKMFWKGAGSAGMWNAGKTLATENRLLNVRGWDGGGQPRTGSEEWSMGRGTLLAPRSHHTSLGSPPLHLLFYKRSKIPPMWLSHRKLGLRLYGANLIPTSCKAWESETGSCKWFRRWEERNYRDGGAGEGNRDQLPKRFRRLA